MTTTNSNLVVYLLPWIESVLMKLLLINYPLRIGLLISGFSLFRLCSVESICLVFRKYVVFIIETLKACNLRSRSEAFFCFVLTLDMQGSPISLHDPSDSLHTFHNNT